MDGTLQYYASIVPPESRFLHSKGLMSLAINQPQLRERLTDCFTQLNGSIKRKKSTQLPAQEVPMLILHIVKQEIATSIRFAFLSLIKPVKDRFLCHSQPACRTSIGEKYFCFQCFLWAQNSLKRKDKMHTKVLFYTKCSFWHSVLVCMIKIGTL